MKKIDSKLEILINTPGDINEHLDTIKLYASNCDTIVELGVRCPVSTFALLAGRPKELISVDILHPSHFTNGQTELDLVHELAKEENIKFSFIQSDSITYNIEKCDLLLIDTWHTYRQLISELITHENSVNKYIILHDTTSYAIEDEANWANSPEPNFNGEIKRGLWPAVEDFLLHFNSWKIHKRFTHNNGLTILEKV
jgi:hypothetical protein